MRHPEKQQQLRNKAAKLERLTRKSIDNQCREKLRHENYWSALRHAIDMTRTTRRLYTPYICEHCGFQHVGSISNSVVWMFGGESVSVTSENGLAK